MNGSGTDVNSQQVVLAALPRVDCGACGRLVIRRTERLRTARSVARASPEWRPTAVCCSFKTLGPGPRVSAKATGVPVRYVKDYPGAMLHIDVKRLGRMPDGGGHRMLGEDFRTRRGGGYDYVHVAADDFSRVGFAEVFPHPTGSFCRTFLLDAAAFFR